MPWEVADRDHPERAGSRWPDIRDATRRAENARPIGRFYVRWVAEDGKSTNNEGMEP